MIESVSGAAEDPSPDSPSSEVSAPASAAAAIAEMLSVEDMPMLDDGGWAARPDSRSAARPATLHARALGAIDDAIVCSLLDNLSPSSRIAGFMPPENEEPAPRSLITRYYEDA